MHQKAKLEKLFLLAFNHHVTRDLRACSYNLLFVWTFLLLLLLLLNGDVILVEYCQYLENLANIQLCLHKKTLSSSYISEDGYSFLSFHSVMERL